MYFKEIMSKEEKQQAKEVFLQVHKRNTVVSTVRKTAGVLGLIVGFHCLSVARYTYNALYFMVGWCCLPIFLYHLWENSYTYKYIKPLKKLKKTDRLFADTLMDEIVIDEEKITINESFSIQYKQIQTVLFIKGFAAVIEKTSQPVIVKLRDERQIQLYRILSDKNKFKHKKNLFVILTDIKAGYYIPEIEKIRKPKVEKKKRKDMLITAVLLLASIAYSIVYIKEHTVTYEELYPDVEYTYVEGESFYEMLEKSFTVGSSISPVIDVYAGYADRNFDTFIKISTDENGEKQLAACFSAEGDRIYVMKFTDNPNEKKREVTYSWFDDRESHIKALFERDYVDGEYPHISNYQFWINDGWKLTLKDNRRLTFNDKGIYRFTENTASFTEKGRERLSIQLENCGQTLLPEVQAMFKQLERECELPYDRHEINLESLVKEINHYILLED